MASDIREIVGRLRPNAEWGWRGGNPEDLSQLRWRDSLQSEPTQGEIDAEQLVLEAENATAEQSKSNREGRGASVVGQEAYNLSPPQTASAIELLLARANAIDIEGKIKPIEEW